MSQPEWNIPPFMCKSIDKDCLFMCGVWKGNFSIKVKKNKEDMLKLKPKPIESRLILAKLKGVLDAPNGASTSIQVNVSNFETKQNDIVGALRIAKDDKGVITIEAQWKTAGGGKGSAVFAMAQWMNIKTSNTDKAEQSRYGTEALIEWMETYRTVGCIISNAPYDPNAFKKGGGGGGGGYNKPAQAAAPAGDFGTSSGDDLF